jgi:hypothetical protein
MIATTHRGAGRRNLQPVVRKRNARDARVHDANSPNESVLSKLVSCSRIAETTNALKSTSVSPRCFSPKSDNTPVSSSTPMRPSTSASCDSKNERAAVAMAAAEVMSERHSNDITSVQVER